MVRSDLALTLGLSLVCACGPQGPGGIVELPPYDGTPNIFVPIAIDGLLGDWSQAQNVSDLVDDPQADGRDKDLQPATIAAANDIVQVRAAHTSTEIYFLVRFAGALPDSGKTSYAVYLDVDRNKKTGYLLAGDVMGADYMVLSGRLMKYTGDGTTWVWSDNILGLRQAAGPQGDTAIELAITRDKIGLAEARQTTIDLAFAGIDGRGTVDWQDDITDYAPDNNGVLAAVPYELGPGQLAKLQSRPLPDVHAIANWVVFYGVWDRSVIEKVSKFDLVVLASNGGPTPAEQGPIVRRIRAGKNGILGDDDDVIVLGYISLGEDVRTFNNQPEIVGDGRGPAYYDNQSGQLVYTNQGVASYYLDEKIGRDINNPGHDGKADRHGTWGACYVHPGDVAWQDFLIGADGRSEAPYSSDALLHFIDYDGLFLDTPEIADPWTGYGYTAKGLHDLIKRLDDTYPNKVLLLNRGLFYFMPQYPHQYRWSPRKYIDIALYESHFLDSNYHCDKTQENCCSQEKDLNTGELIKKCIDATVLDGYNRAPFVPLTKNYSNPKIQVEVSRPDSYMPVLSIDYAARPDDFAKEFPATFEEVVDFSVLRYGRVELITDRWVSATPSLIIDWTPPKDTKPPNWDNTTSGFDWFHPTEREFFMAKGSEAWGEVVPRVGVQKVIPKDSAVTVRWDVAHDQTRPVRYNIYVSESFPIDFAKATVHKNVQYGVGGDYTVRSGSSFDDVCPHEYTISGLQNGKTYYFAVRAEDSTQGGAGPSGGIEDGNTATLAAAPRAKNHSVALAIDAKFDDWKAVPLLADLTSSQERSFSGARLHDDDTFLYIYFATTDIIRAYDWHYLIFLNTDAKSWTGHRGKKGADYLINGTQLFVYDGMQNPNTPTFDPSDGLIWKWTKVADIEYMHSGKELELRIRKSDISGLAERIQLYFAADNGNGQVDYMPDFGAAGFSYTLLR